MSSRGYVLEQGMRDTRAAIARWQRRPWPVLRAWLAWSLAVSIGLLTAVWAVASLATPDSTPASVAGLWSPATAADIGRILASNALVLALHAFACVAGFMAGSSLHHEAERRSGLSRVVHEKAGPVAIAWVALVTCFSLVTQAYALGAHGATLAAQFEISPLLLIATVLPHALLELVALFLPLAAWLVASRRDEWADLLAATAVTVLVAIPALLVSSAIEVTLWPELLRGASPLL
jgi:hypothetical protein